MDKNRSGNLTKLELLEGLRSLGCDVSTSDVSALTRKFDRDGDGLVSYGEFVRELRARANSGSPRGGRSFSTRNPPAGYTSRSKAHPLEDDFVDAARRIIRATGASSTAALRKVFQLVDASGSGRLSREELRRALGDAGYTPTVAEAELLMRRLDQNKDGRVDWREFVERLNSISGLWGGAGTELEPGGRRSSRSPTARRMDVSLEGRATDRLLSSSFSRGGSRDRDRDRERDRDLDGRRGLAWADRDGDAQENLRERDSRASQADETAKAIISRLLIRIGEAAYDKYESEPG